MADNTTERPTKQFDALRVGDHIWWRGAEVTIEWLTAGEYHVSALTWEPEQQVYLAEDDDDGD